MSGPRERSGGARRKHRPTGSEVQDIKPAEIHPKRKVDDVIAKCNFKSPGSEKILIGLGTQYTGDINRDTFLETIYFGKILGPLSEYLSTQEDPDQKLRVFEELVERTPQDRAYLFGLLGKYTPKMNTKFRGPVRNIPLEALIELDPNELMLTFFLDRLEKEPGFFHENDLETIVAEFGGRSEQKIKDSF